MIILGLVNLSPFIFLCVLKNNKAKLDSEECRQSYGSLYKGKNVAKLEQNSKIWRF